MIICLGRGKNEVGKISQQKSQDRRPEVSNLMWAMSVRVDYMIRKHILLCCVDIEEEERGGECSKNTAITDCIVFVM
jgi:hypothetical protein